MTNELIKKIIELALENQFTKVNWSQVKEKSMYILN